MQEEDLGNLGPWWDSEVSGTGQHCKSFQLLVLDTTLQPLEFDCKALTYIKHLAVYEHGTSIPVRIVIAFQS